MKKQLFHDILADTGVPHTIWKFFLISVILHGLLIYALVTAPVTPVDIDVDIQKSPSRQANRPVSSAVDRRPPAPLENVRTGTVERGEREQVREAAYEYDGVSGREQQDTGQSYMDTGGFDNNYIDDDEEARIGTPAGTAVSSNVVYQLPAPKMDFNVDHYVKMYNKPFLDAGKKPVSTFPALPFDREKRGASYRMLKQSLERKQLPPKESIKIEELINSFYYDYPMPEGKQPFSITTELGSCPWAPSHQLLHIGLQGKIVESDIKNKKLIIARDLKLQVELNTDMVAAYRLIGYTKRKPRLGQLKDDWQEGRELHMGQSFTTLYEIIPVSAQKDKPADAGEEETKSPGQDKGEKAIATIKVSYKEPEETGIKRVSQTVWPGEDPEKESSGNFKLSAAAAQFGMMLKDPEFRGISALITLLKLAKDAIGEDRYGYGAKFVKLLEAYKELLKESQ